MSTSTAENQNSTASTAEKLSGQAVENKPVSAQPGGETRTGRGSGRGRLRFALELAALLPLSLLALEALLGFMGVGQQEIVRPDPELGCVHLPGKLVTWRMEGYSREHLSSAGLRDVEHSLSKPQGTYRIAIMGDSAAEGLQVALNETYARRLEQLLNEDLQAGGSLAKKLFMQEIPQNFAQNLAAGASPQAGAIKHFEVINFGCSSYSTGQELLQFKKEVAQYKPDLTIVMICKGDTLENNIDVTQRSKAEPKPYFYLDQTGKLELDTSILQENKDKLSLDSPTNKVLNWLRANSNLYGAVNRTNFNLFLSDKAYFRLTRFAQDMGKRLATQKEAIAVPLYGVQNNRQVTLAVIKEFQRTARAAGSQFAMTLFPDVTASDKDWADTITAIKAQASSDNFGVIDLQPPFRKDKNPSGLFLQFHFSKEGHELTARTIKEFLENTPVKPAP